MGKIIRLTESDLVRIVKRILIEDDVKTSVSSNLKQKGFIYDSYGNEWKYTKNDLEVIVKPIDNKFEITLVLDEPSKNISFENWRKKGKKILDHPMYMIGNKIGNSPYVSQGGSMVIDKTEINEYNLNFVLSKMQDLINLILKSK